MTDIELYCNDAIKSCILKKETVKIHARARATEINNTNNTAFATVTMITKS